MTRYFTSAWNFLKSHRLYSVIGAVLVIALIGAIWRMASSEASPETTRTSRQVEVARVSDLMNGGSGLSVVGEVRSKSEAKISPESSGRITRVYATLGQNVGAGAILAEIENSSQRAAVLQVEGSLDAAKAAAGGSRGSAVPTILTAYAAIDSAVQDAVGQILTDPESSQAAFSVSSRDTQALADIERIRPTLRPILERQESQAITLSETSDIAGELVRVEAELRDVRAYLDIVLKALNAGVPRVDITIATISGYIADVTAARTAITSSLSAISAARTSLDASSSGAVSASQASVKQAQGAYNAALANLEKTRIRSPISGTLNNFDIKLGDTVSSLQQVAVVSNNGALEIVAFVTENDRTKIAVGGKAGIDGGFIGTITRIAPALDPVTRKIEVRIGLPTEALKELTNGESVRVELMQSTSTGSKTTDPLRIPIAALKIESDRHVVYAVDAESKIVAVPVTSGKLSGGFIEITAGIDADTEIVADARGLKEGDSVTIFNNE